MNQIKERNLATAILYIQTKSCNQLHWCCKDQYHMLGGKRCTLSHCGSWINAHNTFEPVCKRGCPATLKISLHNSTWNSDGNYIWRNFSKPSLLCSITSSEKRLVNTLPGRGGIETREESRSRISWNASKSL